MRSWLPAAALSFMFIASVPMSEASAAPRENSSSTAGENDEAALRRVGYQAPEGAKRLSKCFPSKSGEEVAFFEEQGGAVSLVVAIKGGVSARWPLRAESTQLGVFWVSANELMLGADLLSPKMRVKWSVARI